MSAFAEASDHALLRRLDLGMPQLTLGQTVTVSGVGLHSGQPCAVTLRPASADQGITFFRGSGSVRLNPRAVADTRRCTALRLVEGPAAQPTTNGSVDTVETVEHLLASLHALGVDNVSIEVTGPEVPAVDGSALPWVSAIRGAGLVELATEAWAFTPSRSFAIVHRDSCVAVSPAKDLTVTCVTHFDHPLLGTQCGQFVVDADRFESEIAPARTFGFAEEVAALRKSGLARGGSHENAVVIYDDHVSSPLRFPDEFLRHKALDLVGDLFVLGRRLRASVYAVRPGHTVNAALTGALCRSLFVGANDTPEGDAHPRADGPMCADRNTPRSRRAICWT